MSNNIFKILTIILGVLIVIAGLIVIKTGVISEWNIGIKLSNSIDRALFGLLFIALGVVCIAFGIKKKSGVFEIENFIICPECRKTYRESDVSQRICTECKSMLEPLDGFYDRHPEFKKD